MNYHTINTYSKVPEKIIAVALPFLLLVCSVFLMWVEANNIGSIMKDIYKQDKAVLGLFTALIVSALVAISYPSYISKAMADKKLQPNEVIYLVTMLLLIIGIHVFVLFQAYEIYMKFGPRQIMFSLEDGIVRFQVQVVYSVITILLEITIGALAYSEGLFTGKPSKPSSSSTTSPLPPANSGLPATVPPTGESIIKQIATYVGVGESDIPVLPQSSKYEELYAIVKNTPKTVSSAFFKRTPPPTAELSQYQKFVAEVNNLKK